MLDFPASPTSGQYYTSSVRSWRYNGTTWVLLDDPWLDADSFSGQYPSYYSNAANLTGLYTGLVGYRYYATSSSTNTGLGVVLYPKGGYYSTNGTITGAIEITTPLSGENTMLYADVDIYNYSTNKALKMSIGGYLYSSPTWINPSATVISNGEQNLTVRFGTTGDKYKIWIGELTGIWYYPKVLVHNIKLGFASNSPHQWSTGWSVGIQSSGFGTISQTVTNTQIGKYHNGSLIWNAANDGAGSTLDADLLDGQEGAYYRNFGNHTGSITGYISSRAVTGIAVSDTRSVNSPPSYYYREVKAEFKSKSTIDSPSGSSNYAGLITLAPWYDDSGGKHYQLAFNSLASLTGDPVISVRAANPNSGSWTTGSWKELLHTGSAPFRRHVDDTGIHYSYSQITELIQDTVGSNFITFNNGITGIYTDASNTFALSGIDASTTTKGVSSFSSTQFTVTNGAVSLTGAANGSITNAKLIAGDFSSITGVGDLYKDLTFDSQKYKINGGSNLPAGYIQSDPFNFRFDQDVLKYCNRWGTASFNLSGGFTETHLENLFSKYASNVNVASLSDGCSIEVTGISISNSQPAQFWPYVMMHSTPTTNPVVKMEVSSRNHSGFWEVAYSGEISKYHIAQYTMTGSAQTPLVGARWTFISKTPECYVRWLGVIGRNSSEYAWNIMKGGDTIYGDLDFANDYEPTLSGASLNTANGLVKLNSSAQVPSSLISIASTNISDFTEAAQDAVGTSFFTFAGSITGTYNDGSNTFLLSGSSSIGGGVTGHYELVGLTGDDHLQYLTSGRANSWLTGNISFTGHTGQTGIHFTQAEISIPSTQISNFGSAVTGILQATSVSQLLDVSYSKTPDDIYNILYYDSLNSRWVPSNAFYLHTGDSTLHYTQSSISITTGQVVGFIEAVQDIIGTGTFLKGSNGISGIYNDTSNILTLSGVNATTIMPGVAAFDSLYFSVTTGKVSLSNVPLSIIETNTGPYILGVSSVGVDISPLALSTSTVATMLTGYLTTTSAVTGIVTGLTTGYLSKSNNLSDIPDYNQARLNLKSRYYLEDFTPLDGTVWTSSTAGAGGAYQYDPQYVGTAWRAPGANGIVVASAGGGTGAGDAAMRYHSNASLWLSTGAEYYFRVLKSATQNGHIYRFGLFNAFVSTTGDVANGIYFEFNGTSGNEVIACSASGNTRTKVGTAYGPTLSEFVWYSMRFVGTGTEYYIDGDPTPIATIYDNYPSTTAMVSRAFFQCCGTGNNRNIWIDKFAFPYPEECLPSGIPL